jgi:hypothetical protein
MRLTRKGAISMPDRSAMRSLPAILSLALMASACTAGGPTGPPGAAASSSVAPTAIVSTAPPLVATSAPSSSTLSAEPPAAALSVEGGDPVTGQLGSFTWGDGGSDSPWLPGSPAVVGTGERVIVTVGGGVGISEWTAKRVPAGTTDGSGAIGLGGGDAAIGFPAPGPGKWSVQVAVWFAGNLGSATYYWQLTVR